MTEITFYDSFEEMMQAERSAREAADSRVTPEQRKYRIGDIVVSDPGYGFPIFHEILDMERIVKENLERYGEEYEPEGIETLDLYCFNPRPWNYRFARSHSEACPEGELGDFHISVGQKTIPREYFEELKANGFDLTESRICWLLKELSPLTQHSGLYISPHTYESRDDILHLEISPRSSQEWARTAYRFAKHDGMTYDRDSTVYGIDGQPRVSLSGLVWARYIGHFEDGSRVAFHISSLQPSHREAEEQLSELYGLFRERDGLEPVEVFERYF